MESMTDECPSCGSKEISLENYEHVCTSCGEIICSSSTQLTYLPDSEAVVDNLRNKEFESSSRLNGRIRNETNSSSRSKQIYRRKILDDAKKTVKKLVKDSSSVVDIMMILNNALDSMKRTSSLRKSALIGSSIYMISKKNDLGLTISDICKSLGIKLKLFNESMRHIKDTNPQNTDCTGNIYDGFIKNILRKSQLNLMDISDRNLMEKKIKLILTISDKMNIYSKRSPQCIVPAATYLAWKSIKTFEPLDVDPKIDGRKNLQKSGVSFTKFCELFDIRKTDRMGTSAAELTTLFMKLAIPLCSVEKEKDLNYLLDIIMENSSFLLKEYLRIKDENKILDPVKDLET